MLDSTRKVAFTLAEVLITLGIIGVVAAMTMPLLVANYKKQTYVTSLKKFYSEFSQIMSKAKTDTGCSDMECLGFVGASENDEAWIKRMKEFFGKYYKVVEFCKDKDSCIEETYKLDGSYAEKLFNANQFSFVTADGFKIRVQPSAADWTSITIDINGSKKPNTVGRDIFLFRIYNKDATFHPYYGLFYSDKIGANHLYWKKNESLCGWDDNPLPAITTGYGCTARVIESGWKMNY